MGDLPDQSHRFDLDTPMHHNSKLYHTQGLFTFLDKKIKKEPSQQRRLNPKRMLKGLSSGKTEYAMISASSFDDDIYQDEESV